MTALVRRTTPLPPCNLLPSAQARSIPTALFTSIILPFLDLRNQRSCLRINHACNLLGQVAFSWNDLKVSMKSGGHSEEDLFRPEFTKRFPRILHLDLSSWETSWSPEDQKSTFDGQLSILLARFPDLQSILIKSDQMTIHALPALANPKLESISLEDLRLNSDSVAIETDHLESMLPHWPQLRSLKISGAELSPNFALLLSQYCLLIENITVSYINDAFGRVFACPNLRRLSTDSLITDDFLSLIPTHGSKIEDINLMSLNITDRGLSFLGERCPMLRSVQLDSMRITGEGILSIAQNCRDLEEISLTGGYAVDGCELDISDQTLGQLAAHCPKLRSLVLSAGCTQISDGGVARLAKHCPQLERCSIGSPRLTDKSIYHLLHNCPQIKHLRLYSSTAISNKPLVRLASRWPFLQSLHLGGLSITDEGVRHISQCSKLQTLGLSSPQLTNKSLEFLAKNCLRLKKCFFQHSEQITEKAVQSFAIQCCNLERFSYPKDTLSDRDLQSIRTSEENKKRLIHNAKIIGTLLLFGSGSYLVAGTSGTAQGLALLYAMRSL